MKLPPLSPLPDLPSFEKAVFQFWEDENIFKATLDNRRGKPLFNFYDGPPFANGLPHYGHILAMSIKDLFVRYKTLRGYLVPRRNGWDCHGLPVEYEVEKELGLKNKKEIAAYGVAKFNERARQSVFRYVDEWTKTMKRLGRWMDFANAYTTLDNDYIESVWWVLKQIHEAKLLYQDTKTAGYCPRCETPLSNFEVNQGYRDITDISIYLKVNLAGGKKLLIWTTTPWTLSGNRAIAISAKLKYVEADISGERLIMGADYAKRSRAKNIRPLETAELLGQRYQPFYPSKIKNNQDYRIYPADFVSSKEGTGLVHVAPTFGEDDSALGKKEDLTFENTVDSSGKMQVSPGQGKFVKDADADIVADLKKRNLLFKEEKVVHTYPFCWRCETPLIYYSLPAWLIKVSELRDKLVKNNQAINWVPVHLKTGRFGRWLGEAKDWTISRNRFWGAPLPIWRGEKSHEIIVIGSKQELIDRGVEPKKLTDLHRPTIDEVSFEVAGETYRRVPEIFDCWFESGAMPFASVHYPFAFAQNQKSKIKDKKDFEKLFPADFIAEGLDQTRGWFYTLHVIATILAPSVIGRDSPAYKNVVANGLILAPDGKKLSKRLRNYPEPEEIFNTVGADALRQYLFSSSAIGEDYRFSNQLVREEVKRVILPLWNSLVFLKQYHPAALAKPAAQQLLDRWIVNRVYETYHKVTAAFDKYQLTQGTREYEGLITDLSAWYLRRCRKRTDADFPATLAWAIKQISLLIAPAMPHLSEIIYQYLKTPTEKASVHLLDWPKLPKPDQTILNQMVSTRQLIQEILRQRATAHVKVRQPLSQVTFPKLEAELVELVLAETNVKRYQPDSKIKLDTTVTAELKTEGMVRDTIRAIQASRKRAGLVPKQSVQISISAPDLIGQTLKAHLAEIQKSTCTIVKLVSEIEPGEEFRIDDNTITIAINEKNRPKITEP